MTDKRMDKVIRFLDAARTRRAALATLLGSLPDLFSIVGPEPANAGKGKRARRKRRKERRAGNGECGNGSKQANRCTRDNQCCTGICQGKRCRCLSVGDACITHASCCPRTKGQSCQEGTCQPCDVCRSGCAFTSIQAAIDAAAPGDTIHICAGVFGERLTITTDVTLAGVGDGGNGTTLDGRRGGTTVTIAGAEVAFARLRITGGASSGVSGGIGLQDGSLTLTDCTVSGNTALEGAGIGSSASSLLLIASRVTGNRASGSGGGISKQGGALRLENSAVTRNEAALDGGGINHINGASTFIASTISDNEAGSRGGGILFSGGAMSVFQGTRIEGNRAGIEGGGISRFFGSISIIDSTVTGNSPDNCAGEPAIDNCTNS